MKRSDDLDPQRDERRRLKEALKLNESLATAYDLKEDLQQIWQQPGKTTARIVLDLWIADAEASGIRQLMKFARTLQTHREGFLNGHDVPVHAWWSSLGVGFPGVWFAVVSEKQSRGCRPGWRPASMIVSSVSTQRLLAALWVPGESLRQLTA